MFDDLRSYFLFFEIRHSACNILFRSCQDGDHAAELLALEDLDVCENDIEVYVEATGNIRDNGVANAGLLKYELEKDAAILCLNEWGILFCPLHLHGLKIST